MAVDVGLAKLSNDLIAGGIVAYSVGFLGYALDAAYGNHARTSAKVSRMSAATPARALVAATAGTAGASAGVLEERP